MMVKKALIAIDLLALYLASIDLLGRERLGRIEAALRDLLERLKRYRLFDRVLSLDNELYDPETGMGCLHIFSMGLVVSALFIVGWLPRLEAPTRFQMLNLLIFFLCALPSSYGVYVILSYILRRLDSIVTSSLSFSIALLARVKLRGLLLLAGLALSTISHLVQLRIEK